MKRFKRVLIIAEAGVNHNGRLPLAFRLIDAAKACGADVVKFQSFRADNLVVKNAPKARYQIENTRNHGAQWDMLKDLELSPEDHRKLFAYARRRKIALISTPFDEANADLLDRLKVPFFKIPSGEVTHKQLIEHIAAKRKPIILSTGMSSLAEVKTCVGWIRSIWKKRGVNPGLSLLHCVSNYPARPEDCNLKAMKTMRDAFKLPIGYSDHTLGIEMPIAAVALGAQIIEKHLTLDHRMPGPDHRASLEPKAFGQMVLGIRHIEVALGDGLKRAMPSELNIRRIARRSLVSSRPLPKGTRLRIDDIAIKRPGTGIEPKFAETMTGMIVRRHIAADSVLTWKDVRHA